MLYQIDETTIKSILKRKFSSLVGNTLEGIDNFQTIYNLNDKQVFQFKQLVKKLNYEAMRDIEGQISAFSQGVKIGVSLIQPTK